MGNLREELAKRRVLGSRFAQVETQRQEEKFAQLEAQARATSFLEELDATTTLINQETQANIAAASTVLNQLNFESGLAAKLSQAASAAMQAQSVALANVRQASENNALEIIAGVAGFLAG